MTEVKLDFDKQGGLVPVIVTDYKTGQVLMLAYMNELSYQLTLETKQMHYCLFNGAVHMCGKP